MSSKASRAVAVPRMPHLAIRASTTSKPGMSGVTRKAVISFFLSAAGAGRAGHDGQHVGDAAVGDLALRAVEDVGLAVRRRRGGGLHVAGVGAGLRLGQGEGGQLFAADQRRQPAAFLLLGAEQQQGADADAVMGVDEDGDGGVSGRR